MLLAAKLTNCPPIVITRTPEQSHAICEQGIELFEQGVHRRRRVRAYSTEAYIQQLETGQLGPVDVALLTVKQAHIDDALSELLNKAIKPGGIVVCYQNGIGHAERLAGVLGNARVAIAITTEGAWKTSPTSVRHTGAGWTKLGFAHSAGGDWSDSRGKLLIALEDCLKAAGFVISLSNDITSDVWNKLIMNAIINPLTAQYGITNGELLKSPYLLRVMRTLYEEALQVAHAVGVRVDPVLWTTILQVCERTSSNRSSMLQDRDAGRPTEINWLNGSLLRLAEQAGLRLPAHEWIVHAHCASVQSR